MAASRVCRLQAWARWRKERDVSRVRVRLRTPQIVSDTILVDGVEADLTRQRWLPNSGPLARYRTSG